MEKAICLISPKFFNYVGGMETHSFEFAKEFLNDSNYPINAIVTKKIVNDGVPAPKSSNHADAKLFTRYLKPVLTGDFEKDACEVLKLSSPNDTIYYLNSPTWLPAFAIIKKKYPDAKIIVRSGGNDIEAGWVGDENNTAMNLRDARQYVVRLINKYVSAFIVNSNYSRKRALRLGISKEKIVRISGGVNCSAFRPHKKTGKNTITILSASRMVPFKGIEYSLKAFCLASKMTSKKLKYLIIGNGPERKKLECLAKNICLCNVVFSGAKRIQDMPKFFKKADIFLHMPFYLVSSRKGFAYVHTETMGRSLCEAAAAGIPVVASAVGGIPELVKDRETGFLVAEKNYGQAAQMLTALVNDAKLRQNMGKNARNRAEQIFDWAHIFAKYRQMFAT